MKVAYNNALDKGTGTKVYDKLTSKIGNLSEAPLIIDDTRVPASYLNFYIANKIVLLPIFEDKNDDKAFQILEKHFKDRKIVPINCRDLIWGFGAIHCMTQQEPAI